MKVRIRLDTMRDAQDFVSITSRQEGNIFITDNCGLRVNAKSVLGALYSLEFDELWCECDEDIYRRIERFVVL